MEEQILKREDLKLTLGDIGAQQFSLTLPCTLHIFGSVTTNHGSCLAPQYIFTYEKIHICILKNTPVSEPVHVNCIFKFLYLHTFFMTTYSKSKGIICLRD